METLKNNVGKIMFLVAVLLAIFGYTQYAELACKFADNPELCLQEVAAKSTPESKITEVTAQ
ncbi:MAG: hypothetical protein LBE20_00395 [Deltaproteobacteria bacterium]|jgi:hypothetical protein|nr:hypothetical protein [Deltaproteobacteria bacterium]